MQDFTKRKFLSLDVVQQHKKCAELIRSIYGTREKSEQIKKIEIYQEWISWMAGDPLYSVEPKKLADRYHLHLGKAFHQKKEHHLLPQIRIGDKNSTTPFFPIDIYLDQIRSAHNVGSILRTVEAFRLGYVFFSEQTPFVDHKQVQDTSMGTSGEVICKRDIKLSQLRRPIIALETVEKAIPLYDFLFPNEFTLVVGNEEYGCSDESLLLADYFLEIPLRGMKNSLNVANAFAIAASEIVRQKRPNIFEEEI